MTRDNPLPPGAALSGPSLTTTRLILARLQRLLTLKPPQHTQPVKGKATRRSVFIRHVDCGSSNAAEQEITALFNPIYDLERLGFHLVASPRHADVLLLTGPLARNMRPALLAAFYAMPEPRKVVTVGDAFAEDSPFAGSYAIVPLPVEILSARVAHIPGDPPNPDVILQVFVALV